MTATIARRVAACMVPLLGLLGACGGDETKEITQGQLVIAVTTDQEPTRSVSQVRVEVSVRGELRHGVWYDLGPGAQRMPATLALSVSAESPEDVVDVRVMSRNGARLGAFRQVLTTVPRDRVALLHVPLRWLCDGTLDEVGFE